MDVDLLASIPAHKLVRLLLILDTSSPGHCTDVAACNYNVLANTDDGSCDLPNGCWDPLYLEYDPLVTCPDAAACITLLSVSIDTAFITQPILCNGVYVNDAMQIKIIRKFRLFETKCISTSQYN